MRRWLIFLALLAVATAVLAGWLFGTTSGLRFAVEQLGNRLPATIAYRDLDGRLLGPILAKQFTWDAAGYSVSAEDIELDWSATGILGRAIRIDAQCYSDGGRIAGFIHRDLDRGRCFYGQGVAQPLRGAQKLLRLARFEQDIGVVPKGKGLWLPCELPWVRNQVQFWIVHGCAPFCGWGTGGAVLWAARSIC